MGLHRVKNASWNVLIVSSVSLLIYSCGGSSATTANPTVAPAVNGPEQAAPSLDELTSFLNNELERFGVDAEKAVAFAPTGAGNAVFDLQAIPTETLEEDGSKSVDVTLTWTEVLLGDYDQDSVVSAADLTPVGQFWMKPVEYDDPALHDGIAYWPSGDPTGAGAENWRRARVDGNRNGLIELGDITTIAQHWKERLNGYRIYRQGTEDELHWLPHNNGLLNEYSVWHAAPPIGLVPMRFNHLDHFTEGGTYQYFVVPYCSHGQEEGPASGVQTVEIDLNRKPVAVLAATPQTGQQPLSVKFDASGSTDSDGEIVLYELDLDDDGTFEVLAEPQVTHAFTTAGIYLVSLRVTDDSGGQGLAKASIQVLAGDAPIPVLEADPDSGPADLLVEFDASGSSDPDGEIVLYEYDFEGDGEYDLSGESSTTASHVYDRAGLFTATLRVTDDAGNSMTTSVEIDVINQPPVADIVVSESSGKPPLFVRFDAEASHDPDGEIVRYEFDWEGDGVWDAESPYCKNDHTYNARGVFQAIVRVTDNLGAQDTAQIEIATDIQPTADIEAWPLLGQAPLAVTFNAWRSDGGTGYLVGYEWDWDNDGIVDLSTGKDRYATHVFETPGTYDVQLQVINDTGLADTETVAITVEPSDGVPEWHYLTIALGWEPDTELFNGIPAIGYLGLSGDVDYAWFLSANDEIGFGWDEPVAIGDCYSHYTSELGCELASVQGLPTVCYPRMNTESGQIELVYAQASDASGQQWSDPLVIAGSADVDICCFSLAEINGRPAVAFGFDNDDGFYYRIASDSSGTTWNNPVVPSQQQYGRLYDLSLEEVDGRPAIAWANGSSGYAIATDALGESWNWYCVFPNFDGCIYIDLCVVEGHPAVAYYECGDIIGPGKDLWYRRAGDPAGSTWFTAIKLTDSGEDFDSGRKPSMAVIDGLPAVAFWEYSGGGGDRINFVSAQDGTGGGWNVPELVAPFSGAADACSLVELEGGIPAVARENGGIIWAVKF